MNETQFLIKLLLEEENMSKELRAKLLGRIHELATPQPGLKQDGWQPMTKRGFDPSQVIGPGLTPSPLIVPYTITSTPQIGCQHKWPSNWMSVTPPSCELCGQMAFGAPGIVTCDIKGGL